jgi:hypothetical protein
LALKPHLLVGKKRCGKVVMPFSDRREKMRSMLLIKSHLRLYLPIAA